MSSNDTKLKGGWHEPSANARQVGGEHYKIGGEEHWDRAWRLRLDPFQYQITKYVERAWLKNGIQDLEKAKHFIEKYIELARVEGRTGQQERERQRQLDDAAQEARETLLRHMEADITAGAVDLPAVLKSMVLTETGTVTINGREYQCLKGKRSDFEHEGSFGDGRVRWRCKACRNWFYAQAGTLPHAQGHTCPLSAILPDPT